MRLETFEYLWEQGIVKAANEVFDEIPEEERIRFKVKINNTPDFYYKVYSEYNRIRKKIRDNFFNTGNEDEKKIDGHKICACITGALLKTRMISFEKKEVKFSPSVVFSNYAVAFLASIYVMFLFMLSDYEKAGDTEHYEILKQQAMFYFPDTNDGHDPYVQGRIKTLALNDFHGIDFDVLTYADMLFWIEKYNKYQLENRETKT